MLRLIQVNAALSPWCCSWWSCSLSSSWQDLCRNDTHALHSLECHGCWIKGVLDSWNIAVPSSMRCLTRAEVDVSPIIVGIKATEVQLADLVGRMVVEELAVETSILGYCKHALDLMAKLTKKTVEKIVRRPDNQPRKSS